MKKFIIAGGRDFSDGALLFEACSTVMGIYDMDAACVISGTAKGADTLGEEYAEHYGYSVLKRPAEWEKYGKSAGYRRNHQMALEADALIAFWDGKSRGTKNMIEEAHKARLETHVYYY